MSDTGVYVPSIACYERMVVGMNWLPDHPNVLGRVWLRVHRNPISSFALGHIWVTGNGWFQVEALHKDAFWFSVPGYQRAKAERTEVETMKPIVELFDRMAETARTLVG